MFVYANSPVISTKDIIEILSKRSDDPLVQVVCLAYDLDTMHLAGYGVNRLIHTHENSSSARNALGTDKHPAKKLLIRHAELDFLKDRTKRPDNPPCSMGVYVSLQPCMHCVSALLDSGFVNIEYKTENRHQDEQEIMKPFLNQINYNKNEEGYMLQVPRWLIGEREIEEHFRSARHSQA